MAIATAGGKALNSAPPHPPPSTPKSPTQGRPAERLFRKSKASRSAGVPPATRISDIRSGKNEPSPGGWPSGSRRKSKIQIEISKSQISNQKRVNPVLEEGLAGAVSLSPPHVDRSCLSESASEFCGSAGGLRAKSGGSARRKDGQRSAYPEWTADKLASQSKIWNPKLKSEISNLKFEIKKD